MFSGSTPSAIKSSTTLPSRKSDKGWFGPNFRVCRKNEVRASTSKFLSGFILGLGTCMNVGWVVTGGAGVWYVGCAGFAGSCIGVGCVPVLEEEITEFICWSAGDDSELFNLC